MSRPRPADEASFGGVPRPLVLLADATLDDAAAIAALHAASWRATYRGSFPDAFLDGPLEENRRQHWEAKLKSADPAMFVLQGMAGGRLIGFACVHLDADARWGALLDNLHVAPGATGHGVGARLFGEVRARVRQLRPAQGLHLWVLEANAGAQRFYQRHGGLAIERRPRDVLPGIRVPEVRYAWPFSEAAPRT